MAGTHDFTAGLVEAGAPGYAGAATELLLERRPDVAERYGKGAFNSWKRHLTQRLAELAAALLVDDADLFASEVAWSRVSFDARDVPTDDLQTSLECLRDTLAEELPETAGDKPRELLEAGLAALAETAERPAEEPAADPTHERLTLSYLEAALSGDRRRAVDIVLSAVDDGLGARDAYREVLTAAQRRVGRMWHEHRVSVPQEHFVTATTHSVMTLLAHRAERRPANDKTALVGVVPGNAHELGARVLADFLDLEGWRVVHLGGELPSSDLAVAADVFDADLVALSIALSTQVRGGMEAISRVREATDRAKILVGGALLAKAPDVWRPLGADAAAADVDDALVRAGQLVGLA